MNGGGRQERDGGGGGRGPSSAPYLGRNFLSADLGFGLTKTLRVVEGRLGLGVSACGRWLLLGVLGAQLELCKARVHAGGLAEGLRARDHGRRRRR